MIIHGDCTGRNICHQQIGPTVTQDFAMAKVAVLLTFAKDNFFKPLPTLTDLQLRSLV